MAAGLAVTEHFFIVGFRRRRVVGGNGINRRESGALEWIVGYNVRVSGVEADVAAGVAAAAHSACGARGVQ